MFELHKIRRKLERWKLGFRVFAIEANSQSIQGEPIIQLKQMRHVIYTSFSFLSFFLSFFFLLCCTCRIVIPEPGVKPVSPVVEVRSFSDPLDCQASPLIDCFEASFHFKALLYTENRKISQVHSWDLHFCCISISVVKKMNPLYKGVTK